MRVEGWHLGGSYLSDELWKAPGAIALPSISMPGIGIYDRNL